jgi:type IV pilus assembly protein PilW
MKTPLNTMQKGLSLVELMIAMALSLVVAAAMIMLFAQSKQTYILNENLARLQENGRFALHFLSTDLRRTDYRACTLDIVPLLPTALAGVDDMDVTGLDHDPDSVTIVFQTDECPNPGTFVLPSPPTTVSTVYSIQPGNSGTPSLFRSINGAAAVELVENIVDLQILYGEDTDNDDIPNYYVDVDSVNNMAEVVSVRLTLTAQTADPIGADSGNRMTREFVSTIVLRNRVPII